MSEKGRADNIKQHFKNLQVMYNDIPVIPLEIALDLIDAYFIRGEYDD